MRICRRCWTQQTELEYYKGHEQKMVEDIHITTSRKDRQIQVLNEALNERSAQADKSAKEVVSLQEQCAQLLQS